MQYMTYGEAYRAESREAALETIDLELIAAFCYTDVRALPYDIRHGLLKDWPDKALFSSGSGHVFGRKTFTREELANLVFNLFIRGVRRNNFVYQSASGSPFFYKEGLEKLRVNLDKKGVTPCDTRYGRNALLGECSCMAWSFCQVLIAFGFSPSEVGAQIIVKDGADDKIALRCRDDLAERWRKIYGVDLECALTSTEMFNPETRKDCDRYTAPPSGNITEYFSQAAWNEFNRQRQGATYASSWIALRKVLKGVAAAVAPQLSNSIAVSEVGLVEPTNRDVYENHYCSFIKPQRGERWKAPYFDSLYRLRFSDGLTGFFESYVPATPKIVRLSQSLYLQEDERTTSRYISEENRQRCLCTVPKAIYQVWVDFCAQRLEKMPDDWNGGLIDIDTLPNYFLSILTFSYEDDQNPLQEDLNLFEFYQKRHPTIYIVADERDIHGQRDPLTWVTEKWLKVKIAEIAGAREAKIGKVIGPTRKLERTTSSDDLTKETPKLTRSSSMMFDKGIKNKKKNPLF